MKLLVLGAIGPTGRHVVDRALASGDDITVLVRKPVAVDDLAGQVTVVAGDATSPRDVAKPMMGQDAVISALGRGRSVKGAYRVADRLEMQGAPTISRADVADFMVKAAHSREWIHRDAVITD